MLVEADILLYTNPVRFLFFGSHGLLPQSTDHHVVGPVSGLLRRLDVAPYPKYHRSYTDVSVRGNFAPIGYRKSPISTWEH